MKQMCPEDKHCTGLSQVYILYNKIKTKPLTARAFTHDSS